MLGLDNATQGVVGSGGVGCPAHPIPEMTSVVGNGHRRSLLVLLLCASRPRQQAKGLASWPGMCEA